MILLKSLSNSWSFSVYGDIRAVTGKDPSTGKELSTKERLIAAGCTLLDIIPVGKALLDGAKKVLSKAT